MRPNLFVAFPVTVGPWLERARGDAPRIVRVFADGDIHATLAFLGAVDEAVARSAFAVAVRDVTPLLPPVTATLGEIVPLGSRRRPSALSVLLDEPTGALARAIGSSRAAVSEAAGARPDDRPPLPHVTFARPSRRASHTDRAAAVRWATALDHGHESVRIDRIALYTWSENREESLFRILAEHPLDAEVEPPRPPA